MKVIYEVQVSSNGEVMWLHSSAGDTVGRFSKKFGIDLHTTSTAQAEGAAQCLHCTHRPGTQEDWETFRAGILQHYQFDIPQNTLTFE